MSAALAARACLHNNQHGDSANSHMPAERQHKGPAVPATARACLHQAMMFSLISDCLSPHQTVIWVRMKPLLKLLVVAIAGVGTEQLQERHRTTSVYCPPSCPRCKAMRGTCAAGLTCNRCPQASWMASRRDEDKYICSSQLGCLDVQRKT